MAIQLVKDDERLVLNYEGDNFYYRRPPIKLKKKWTNECTSSKGVTDFYGVIEKAIPWCLLDWDEGAVIDSENNVIPFSDSVALQLPEDFYIELANKLGISQPEQEEVELKNSKST